MMIRKSRNLELTIFLMVCIFASGCGAHREVTIPRSHVDQLDVSSSFLGEWEGLLDDSQQIAANLKVEKEHLIVEYLTEPKSVSRLGYSASRDGEKMIVTIEDVKEPLTVKADGNNLKFELNEKDRRKPDVPRLTTYTFKRVFMKRSTPLKLFS